MKSGNCTRQLCIAWRQRASWKMTWGLHFPIFCVCVNFMTNMQYYHLCEASWSHLPFLSSALTHFCTIRSNTRRRNGSRCSCWDSKRCQSVPYDAAHSYSSPCRRRLFAYVRDSSFNPNRQLMQSKSSVFIWNGEWETKLKYFADIFIWIIFSSHLFEITLYDPRGLSRLSGDHHLIVSHFWLFSNWLSLRLMYICFHFSLSCLYHNK